MYIVTLNLCPYLCFISMRNFQYLDLMVHKSTPSQKFIYTFRVPPYLQPKIVPDCPMCTKIFAS